MTSSDEVAVEGLSRQKSHTMLTVLAFLPFYTLGYTHLGFNLVLNTDMDNKSTEQTQIVALYIALHP